MTIENTLDNAQFEPFARQRLIEWWDQRRLAESQVLVVGAGALGNEVLKNLALVGVGNIYIVDFDIVEPSNLSRSVLFRIGDAGQGYKAEVAARRVSQMHPYRYAQVAYFHGDLVWELGAGVYRAMDVVLGCLDNVEARRFVNMCCWKAEKPWIDGAIHKLSGSVAFYTTETATACYECGVGERLRMLANERYSCLSGVVRTNIQAGNEPTTQTSSAIVAAIQTQEAIKVCHGMAIPGGRKVYYNGLLHNFDVADPSVTSVTEMSVNPACFCHAEDRFGHVTVFNITNTCTVGDLLDLAAQEFGMDNPELVFGTFHTSAQGRRFAITAMCPSTGYTVELYKPAHQVRDVDVTRPGECPGEGPEMRLRTLNRLDRSTEFCGYTLGDLGIPNLDIVKIVDGLQERYVQIGQNLQLVFRYV
ncbi:MAG: ThiF family adenylyltransferase [Chloroflexaceae bacterium]|nr:ThiF family adenylyltransferase [Chloroflexaceae bacterium]